MRNFRYIESGHGDDSLSNHEINELDVDFDIQVDGFYALMPVTEAEYKLLENLNNMDWKVDEYKLPTYDPGAEKPSEPAKTPGEAIKISSVVAERFMQMDMDICEFIRQEVEKEVKAELDRRGFENSEY